MAAPAAPETRVEPAIDAGAFDGPAASAPVITDNVRARLLAERGGVEPGGTLDLALVLDIRPRWHTYWRNPGDSGEPPRIDWTLPDGVTAGPIRWPLPAPIPVGPLVNYGYSDRAVHLVEIRVPADWPAREPLPVRAEADWLVCEEACIPEQGGFSLTLSTDPVGAASPSAEVRRLFADARAELPQAGLVAASLARGSDALRLRVPAAALPASIDDAHFFPDAWGLVNHAAPQRWRREAGADGGDLLLALTPGDAAGSVHATGLLKVTSADAAVGLRLDATAAAAPGETGPGAASVSSAASSAASAGAQDLGLPLALTFALLGGLVLNLMPCVFPVLAIKALGLAAQGGARFSARALHGLAYAAGVIVFFLALGLLLLALRAGGAAVGWGFQLQSPLFVTLMAYLFVVLGMSLAGALTLGTGLMGIGQGMDQGMGG
ncbi:protein-disulfide reductase DsbD domain-containing protein, partial [Thiohalocapsa halophila]